MSDILGGIKIPSLAGDPVNSPPASYVFLYVVGSSYRMKLSNGSVVTFATGVSPEDVQDIIGSSLGVGSSKLSFNYDDVNNTLVFDVVTANILHQELSGAGTNTHTQIDAHIASTSNPHTTTKAQVGLGNADNTSDLNKPISTATQTALNGKENVITAATSADYYRGDKTFQPLNKTAVGLPNVDNTSDLNKPVSTATQTALNGKENTVAAATSADYYRGDKTFQPLNKTAVGLPNVDNTSDLNKPISTATQTALNNKENNITATTAADYYRGDKTFQPLNKTAVGLANVDNTSDLNKPISTAIQTALNLKYDTSNPSGFETPAQLNTRDTNNRNRSNHTGSQLAATISDFGAAVLATVLSGFTIGANAAIAATDTVLQAFGKVQGQINAINAVLLAQILGDQFQEFSDLTAFTTTANTNQSAALFTTNSKPAAKYRIAIEWDWSHNNATADSIYAVFVDNVQVSQEFRYELSDTAAQLLNNHWFYYPTFATTTTHTIELRCRNETAGQTVTVSQVRAEIWRVI